VLGGENVEYDVFMRFDKILWRVVVKCDYVVTIRFAYHSYDFYFPFCLWNCVEICVDVGHGFFARYSVRDWWRIALESKNISKKFGLWVCDFRMGFLWILARLHFV
jgi:hypothetical protein